MGKEKLGYILGGTRILFDNLKKFIEDNNGIVKTSTKITKISYQNNKFHLYDEKNGEYEFNSVFSTIPNCELAEMITDLHSEFASQLYNVRYQSVVCVVLMLKKSLSNI